MNRRSTVARARFAACAGAALAAAVCGCAVIGEQYVLGRQFTEGQAQEIRKGETKKEVLDRLGPPGAVARPGGGEADNVFRRFAATGGDAADRLLYRYDASALEWAELCVYGQAGGGCMPSTPQLKVRNLWILFDGKTGRVVDHFVEETIREETGVDVTPWLGP